MRVAWFMAVRHLMHYRGRSTILVLCVACVMFLPLATRMVAARFRADLTARADTTPMVLGVRGSKVDLALLAMYFRSTTLATMNMGDFATLRDEVNGLVVPLHVRFTARNVRIVATTPEYFEVRGLRAQTGSLPRILGEVVLGARAARSLVLDPGKALFSDQTELYDISKPPALKMNVCGVLAGSGSADDDAVFVDLKTAWILEGLSHGHGDPKTLPGNMVLDRTDKNVVVSEQLIHYNEVTPDTAPTFHLHASPEQMPLSALLVFPRDDREGTIVRAKVNEGHDSRLRGLQAIVSREVVDELLAAVLRLRVLVDAISIVLAGTTGALLALIVALSTKVRERELLTLHRLGCPASTVGWMIGFESLNVLGIGALAASAMLGVVAIVAPRLMSLLM